MSIGKLVWDHALGMGGVIISTAWVEPGTKDSPDLPWEWLVLYDNAEFIGADTDDLEIINEAG